MPKSADSAHFCFVPLQIAKNGGNKRQPWRKTWLAETHRDSPRLTETYRDLPRLHRGLHRGLHRDLPRLTETLPRLSETFSAVIQKFWFFFPRNRVVFNRSRKNRPQTCKKYEIQTTKAVLGASRHRFACFGPH